MILPGFKISGTLGLLRKDHLIQLINQANIQFYKEQIEISGVENYHSPWNLKDLMGETIKRKNLWSLLSGSSEEYQLTRDMAATERLDYLEYRFMSGDNFIDQVGLRNNGRDKEWCTYFISEVIDLSGIKDFIDGQPLPNPQSSFSIVSWKDSYYKGSASGEVYRKFLAKRLTEYQSRINLLTT